MSGMHELTGRLRNASICTAAELVLRRGPGVNCFPCLLRGMLHGVAFTMRQLMQGFGVCLPAILLAGVVVVPAAQRTGPGSIQKLTQVICIAVWKHAR